MDQMATSSAILAIFPCLRARSSGLMASLAKNLGTHLRCASIFLIGSGAVGSHWRTLFLYLVKSV